MINKMLHGDCLELMKDIPNGSIDMILAQGFDLTTNLMGQIAQNRCYKLAAVN